LLDFRTTLDLQPLVGLKGGKPFAQCFFRHGPNGPHEIGDRQGFSNIDSERPTKAEEFWYEQRFLATGCA